eukprot:219414_1
MSTTTVLLCTFAHIVFSYNNGEAETPAMGWNTWCSIGNEEHGGCRTDVCNQWEVFQVAQSMKENGMYDLGYNYVNLDDCWIACERSSNGSILPDPNRFPDGIKALVNKLHNIGFKFGLYTSAGSTTCNAGGRNCSNGKPPGSYGHYIQDANTFALWGVDYVKIDWCGGDRYNATQQHTQFSNALNATGRHIWLELCRGYSYPPPPYVAQVANSWRISGDHHDNWNSTIGEITKSINATNMSAEYNWGFNDFLMTGGEACIGQTNPNVTGPHCPGQTDYEYIAEYTMWAIINSPLLVATDVRNMTDIMKFVLLNKDVISVNQNAKYAAGNIVASQTRNCDPQQKHACQVWAKQLDKNSAAIVLYNYGTEAHSITVDFSSIPGLKWTSVTKLELKDLWYGKDLGTFTGSYTNGSVHYHSVQLIQATESTNS